MAHPIKCVVCKATHNTIDEVKFCHMQNKAYVNESNTSASVANAKVQTKTKTPIRHTPVSVKTFTNKEEALEFVENNPGSRLKDTVKVKCINVFNKETEKYENKEEKTYTVVL